MPTSIKDLWRDPSSDIKNLTINPVEGVARFSEEIIPGRSLAG
jgi:hypothetical protein